MQKSTRSTDIFCVLPPRPFAVVSRATPRPPDQPPRQPNAVGPCGHPYYNQSKLVLGDITVCAIPAHKVTADLPCLLCRFREPLAQLIVCVRCAAPIFVGDPVVLYPPYETEKHTALAYAAYTPAEHEYVGCNNCHEWLGNGIGTWNGDGIARNVTDRLRTTAEATEPAE